MRIGVQRAVTDLGPLRVMVGCTCGDTFPTADAMKSTQVVSALKRRSRCLAYQRIGWQLSTADAAMSGARHSQKKCSTKQPARIMLRDAMRIPALPCGYVLARETVREPQLRRRHARTPLPERSLSSFLLALAGCRSRRSRSVRPVALGRHGTGLHRKRDPAPPVRKRYPVWPQVWPRRDSAVRHPYQDISGSNKQQRPSAT